MIWAIALGILVLLAIIPVGVSLIYNEDGMILSLLLGVIRLKLFPRNKKEKPDQKKRKKATKSVATGSKSNPKKKKGGKLSDFLPIIDIVIQFLGRFRRKLRIKRLDFDLILAAEDPCDLAIGYGRSWAAVGNLMPLLEQAFVIKKRNVQVNCDFLADTTRITVQLDATVAVGHIVAIAVKYGVLAFREYMKLKKAVL